MRILIGESKKSRHKMPSTLPKNDISIQEILTGTKRKKKEKRKKKKKKKENFPKHQHSIIRIKNRNKQIFPSASSLDMKVAN